MTDAVGTAWLLRSSQRGPPYRFSAFYLLIAGLSFISLLANIAGGATCYLDATIGNDITGDGSIGKPWKTISKALASTTSGDNVIMASGTYDAFVDTRPERNNWLTFQAADGAQPQLPYIKIGSDGWNKDAYLHFKGLRVISNPADTGGNRIFSATDVNYVKVQDCYLYGYKRYLDIGVYFQGNNIEINHCEIFYDLHPTENFPTIYDASDLPGKTRGIECKGQNISIINNYIHDMASSGIYVTQPSTVLIQNNHLANQRRVWPGPTEGEITNTVHGSGIALNSGNITIRRNIIRGFGRTRIIGIYGAVGDWHGIGDNIIIESNLMYDLLPSTAVGLNDGLWGTGCKFNHNTVICRHQESPAKEHYERYMSAIGGAFADTYSGDFEFYNNLIVGRVQNVVVGSTSWVASTAYSLDSTVNSDYHGYVCIKAHVSTDDDRPGFGNNWQSYWQLMPPRVWNCSGNIIFSYLYPYQHSHHHGWNTMANSTILCSAVSGYGYGYKGKGWDPETDFFIADSAEKMLLPTPPYPGQYYTTADFRLKTGSPAINYGDVTKAIATGKSLGTLGSDGFIKDDGVMRDQNHHSAGSHEYNNEAPVLESIGNRSVNENSLLSFTANAADPDGDLITYSAQNLPAGAIFTGQAFSWTPTYEQAGTYQVTFIASDTARAQDSETLTITVNNVNRAPVLSPIGNRSLGENELLQFSVGATDADGDTITYSVQNLPSGASFASQRFSWTPAYNQAGTYQVTFTVSDGQAQDSETITITVENVNQAPVLSRVGNQSVFATDLLTFSVQAADADGDRIQYSAQGLPSGATFTNQNFSWTPTAGQIGTYSLTFIASDGRSRDSEVIAITVYAEDKSPPTVTNCVPAPDSVQGLLNTVIYMHIVDTGKGVDANSVSIKVNNGTVHSGNTTHYSSQTGDCRRTGTKADYAFTYQQNEKFNFEQEVTVTVNATDLGGNAMPEYKFSFWTEMRSFGKNKRVSLGLDNLGNAAPATVRDSTGNVWVVWHAGPAGSRDVYLAMLAEGASSFGNSIQLTADSADQCNPAIAIDGSDNLYVVWQDNRRGNWDVYVSTCADQINWSAERLVTDSNDNQINPAIAIDRSSPSRAYIVWQDDRAGSQDIYIATSSDGFITKTVSRITANASDQTDPAVAVDSANTVYVVWTDKRNSSNDIYGAASNSGPWTNVPIVNKAGNQSSPAIAAETAGSILHLLWVDDASGNSDIYHAATNGLPSSPVTGSSIIDDSSGRNQVEPAIAVTGSTGNNVEVFACWQDRRNVAGASGDTDLYFVAVGSDGRTNVFVGDDSTNSNQSQPAISVDAHGQPYLVWNDSRSANPQIYYAGSTYLNPEPSAWQLASPFSVAIVGTNPANITSVDDVSVMVPAGACPCDIRITISEIKNPQEFTVPCLAGYDFGPSGIQFNQPVTITIPYAVPASQGSVKPYWYNSLSGALTQQGITDIKDIVISTTLHAVSFKTTHFTPFYVVEGTVGGTGDSGGGGGCSVSAAGSGSIVEFLLPYMVLAAVMMMLKLHDTRERKAREAAGRQC